MLFCFDNLHCKCSQLTAINKKYHFRLNQNHSNHHTPQNNPKKSFLNPTSNVPLTVSQILCRSIAAFSLAKKLFHKIQHILKRAFSAILKPKMLFLFLFFYLRHTRPRYFSKKAVSFAMIPFFFSTLKLF